MGELMAMTNEEAIQVIWAVLHGYSEDSLGNRIGVGHYEENDDEFADQWALICEAMAHIHEQLGAA